MKRSIKKLRELPVFSTLLILFVAYIPFQCRHTSLLKPFSKAWFASQPNLPATFDSRLDLYLNELIMILLIGMVVWNLRHRFKEISLAGVVVVLFLSFSFLSVVLSPSAPYHWPYWRWLQLVLPLLFSLLIPMRARPRDVVLCFGMLFSLALFESIVGAAQYLIQDRVGLKSLGELKINPLDLSCVYVESKTRWLIDKLIGYQTMTPRILRAAATFPHPNILGAFLGLSLFAGCFFWLRKASWRIPLSFALFTLILGLCLTYSRAALFGVFGGLSLFALMIWPLVSKKAWAKLALLLMASALFCGVLLHEQFLERGGIINYNEFVGRADRDRIHYQNVALTMVKAHPFLGVGPGQFAIEMHQHVEEGAAILQLQTVHNVYLLLAAETGLIGLTLFLAFVALSLWKLWKCPPTLERAVLLSMWAFVLWLGCCDHFLITTHHGRLLLFLTVGLSSIHGYASERARLQHPIPTH
ncbi:MAG: hypothetical protein K940chlam2_01040 [Chlamydiae bacterium]|nr:hypothetical protein [Chlamydiota bacterium]